jgi:hypothetical protein
MSVYDHLQVWVTLGAKNYQLAWLCCTKRALSEHAGRSYLRLEN